MSVRVEGDPRPLPAGIDLSAYRIVQEGLTNALKHAGPARPRCVVRYGERRARARGDATTAAAASPAANGGGHGLVGMRERVALYGGDLEAGPRARGRLRACARGCRSSRRPRRDDPRPDRRRPGAGARRVRDDPRRPARHRGGGRGRRRARGGRHGARAAPRRRADGHPHARGRRHRGDPAPDRRRRRARGS